MFHVIISRGAGKSLRRIPEHYRRRVLELLLILRDNPVPAEYYDIKKLKGYANLYRARIGDIRVIFEVLWDEREIHVLLIERRERVYQ